MNSFIAWVGGKHLLANEIIALMPPHKCYVEVFGGAGWTLFKKPRASAEVEVYNDLNSDLVNLFRVVRGNLEEFIRRQYLLLSSRQEYQSYQARYKTGDFKDNIERAIAFYYLIKNSFGSRIIDGSYGYSKKGRCRYNSDFTKLAGIRERLKTTYIENLSFDSLIPRYDSPETLFYCDPPYWVALNGKYYQCNFTEADHQRLADVLKGIKGKFILSYDDVPTTRKLYDGFNIQTTQPVRYSTNNLNTSKIVRKSELIVTNF